MSNRVIFTNAKLWKNEHNGRNGSWYTFSISVSKKTQEGNYINKGMRVFTSRDNAIPTDIPNGSLVDIDGFLTLDAYQGRDGEVKEIAVFANKIVFKDGEFNDSFVEADDDIPF